MAGKEYIILITTTLMVLHPSCILSEECPRLPFAADYESEKLNRTFPYVRGKNSIRKSEFLCDFIWTGEEHLKEKLLHRLMKRKKKFCTHHSPRSRLQQPVPLHVQRLWLPHVDMGAGLT